MLFQAQDIADKIDNVDSVFDSRKDAILIQHFILEQFSLFKQFCLKKEFFRFDDTPPEVRSLNICLIPTTVLLVFTVVD